MKIRNRKRDETSQKETRKSSKKKKHPIGRPPNGLLYFFAFVLAYPMAKLLFRLDDGRKDFAPPKGPFLIVANHSTMLDFLLVMLPFYPRRINAIITNRYFFSHRLKRILTTMGCIPKSQFEPDVLSIKRVISVIRRGGSILLFPEGRCSTDGAFAGIHTSTGKLVKHLGVPVISCYIEGAYSCVPHWRKSLKTGRIRVSVNELFTADDTSKLSVEEINDALCLRLSGKSGKRPGAPTGPFREKRLAQGLEQILFWCPCCNKEYTMLSSGNRFVCTACRVIVNLDKNGNLNALHDSALPKSIHDWYMAQAEYLSARLSETMKPLSKTVTIEVTSTSSKNDAVKSGSGNLTLSPVGWAFTGEIEGANTHLAFPIDTVPAIPFEYNGDFLIYAHGNIYRFNASEGVPGTEIAMLGELAHKKFAIKPLITMGATRQLPTVDKLQ